MKPDIPLVLADLALKLRETILPELAGFQANTVGMTAAMLEMMAEAWDDAAERLVGENDALVALLVRGTDLTGDPGFAAAARQQAADLKLSSLEEVNDRRRRALVDLQARIEAVPGAEAQALNDAIWTELRASTDRRRVSLANF